MVDAVLSINRQYDNFVIPRVKIFQERYNNINSLDSLINLIDSCGREGFCRLWNYHHVERVRILEDLAKMFLDYKTSNDFNDDLEAMKHWAKSVDTDGYKSLNISGIGLATFQYIRMMLGVSTVKPDTHILKAVETAIGKKQSRKQAIELFVKASEKMGLDPVLVDHNVWKFFSNKEFKNLEKVSV